MRCGLTQMSSRRRSERWDTLRRCSVRVHAMRSRCSEVDAMRCRQHTPAVCGCPCAMAVCSAVQCSAVDGGCSALLCSASPHLSVSVCCAFFFFGLRRERPAGACVRVCCCARSCRWIGAARLDQCTRRVARGTVVGPHQNENGRETERGEVADTGDTPTHAQSTRIDTNVLVRNGRE